MEPITLIAVLLILAYCIFLHLKLKRVMENQSTMAERFEAALKSINENTNKLASKLQDLQGKIANSGMEKQKEQLILNELEQYSQDLYKMANGEEEPAEDPVEEEENGGESNDIFAGTTTPIASGTTSAQVEQNTADANTGAPTGNDDEKTSQPGTAVPDAPGEPTTANDKTVEPSPNEKTSEQQDASTDTTAATSGDATSVESSDSGRHRGSSKKGK